MRLLFSAKGFPIKNIGILTQNGDFIPMLSPLLENKTVIQDDFTLSKVSKPYRVNGDDGTLLLANYGSKLYIFDTTFGENRGTYKDVLKYHIDTHKKEILPKTRMPFPKFGFVKSTRIGHHFWVFHNCRF